MNPTPEHDRSHFGRRPGPERPGPSERRAYPNAPTVTRPSYARPGTARRSGAHTARPIPATVWTFPPAAPELPGSPAAAGSGAAAITAAIVSAFSEPHGRVGILAWPTPAAAFLARTQQLATSDAAAGRGTRGATSAAVGEVTAAITAQLRTPILLSLPTVPANAGTGVAASAFPGQLRLTMTAVSLVDESAGSTEPLLATPTVQRSPLPGEPVGPLDLIISSVSPVYVDEATAARVALAAGPALRLGGVLTVLTHSHRANGRLADPGGRLVSAAQNADLLYLQHIVVLHTPTEEPPVASEAGFDPADAQPQRWPVRHQRTHMDLYVFEQPHDHHTPDSAAGHDPLGSAASATNPASTPATGNA